MQINAYGSGNVSSTKNELKPKEKNDGSNLDMSDFLNLLVAQMTNQDSMNPMENTEFVAQLAQFSSLQAMSTLTQISEQTQATSLIGKTVVMAKMNNKGELIKNEGKVERVTIHSGKTKIYVGGAEYEMANLMEIKADPVEAPKTDANQGALPEGDSQPKP